MSNDNSSSDVPDTTTDNSGGAHESYVVVARRYRPRTFGDLVGQDHICQALVNAINSNRVGHAYLFTGARGVGKTSTARIFAKALNAPNGPTPDPDNDTDICQAIDAGEDVDVLEIDGASNRGIDEIRQLRSNANVRPSRARYKIYIIDEVHMLTTAAFNALLKTLEEPPAHVKFILCTTDPQKVPITVLSRCQRYDFAPVGVPAIVERLRHIVATEGRQSEPEALELLARRAEGSMRDSQSLLEQLLAYCHGPVRLEDVHRMMGTAPSGRLAAVADRLIQRDAAGALTSVDEAVAEGIDCGQLAEQLLAYLRDMMAVQVGCGSESLRHTSPEDYAALEKAGQQYGLETTLAAFEILDAAVVRMRQTTQPRMVLEIAIVRICNLENLDQLSALIADLQQGVASTSATRNPVSGSAAANPISKPSPQRAETGPSQKKNPEKVTDGPSEPLVAAESRELNAQTADTIWQEVLNQLGDMTADFASYYDRVAITAPDSLVVYFREEYTLQKESCEQPDRKVQLEQALARIAGRHIRINMVVIPDGPQRQAAPPPPSMFQLMREKEAHPFVRRAVELFAAEVVRVDVPRNPRATSSQPRGD